MSENQNHLNDQSSVSYLKFGVLPTWIVAIFLIGFLLKVGSAMFIWIIMSILLVALLDPYFHQLRKRNMSTSLAATLLVLGFFISLTIALSILIYFSRDITSELQDSKRVLMNYYDSISTAFKSYLDNLAHTPIKDAATGRPIAKVQVIESTPLGGSIGAQLLTGFGSVMSVVTYFCLWPILTLFILIEREVLGKVILRAFKKPEQGQMMWRQIVTSTRAFFLGNLFLVLVSVPVFAIIFKILSVPNFLVLAILAAIINVIPFVGALGTGLLPALTLMAQYEPNSKIIWLYILCVFIHFIVANLVSPKLLGKKVNLNATTSTIALIAWSLLWGAMGLLLAIPLTACIRIIFENSGYPWLCWIAALMSEKIDPVIGFTIGWKKRKPAPEPVSE